MLIEEKEQEVSSESVVSVAGGLALCLTTKVISSVRTLEETETRGEHFTRSLTPGRTSITEG